MIAPTDIKLGEDLGVLELVDDVRRERQGVVILHGYVVELPVILD